MRPSKVKEDRKKCPGKWTLTHEEIAREVSVSDVGTHKSRSINVITNIMNNYFSRYDGAHL